MNTRKTHNLEAIENKILEHIDTFDGEYNKRKSKHIIRIDNKVIAELNDREYGQIMSNIVVGNILPPKTITGKSYTKK